jgi:hypothetical protein
MSRISRTEPFKAGRKILAGAKAKLRELFLELIEQ